MKYNNFQNKIINFLKTIYYSNIFLISILGAGFLLRLIQYLINHTIWLDEAFLAINIIRSNYVELFHPLKYYGQAAPLVFLIITKFFTKTFGLSEFAFRLLPSICGIATLPIAYFLGKKFLDKKALGFFIILFSFSRFAIYHSAEAKQYSLELVVSMLVILLAYKIYEQKFNTKYIIFFGLFGIFSIWSSLSSVFILTGSFIALFIEYLINKRKYKIKNFIVFLMVGLLCIVNFFIYYIFILKDTINTKIAFNYFAEIGYLPPSSINSLKDLLWLPRMFLYSLKNPLGLAFPITDKYGIPLIFIIIQYIIIIIFFFFGIFYIFKNKKFFISMLLFIPILLLIFASFLKFYILQSRFLLFTLPVSCLIIAFGFLEIFNFLSTKIRKIGKLLFIAILIIFLIFPVSYGILGLARFGAAGSIKPQIRREDKPVLEFYLKNKLIEDKIYIYPSDSNNPVYIYYTEYYFGNFKNQIFLDYDYGKESEKFLEQLKNKIDNERLWIVFSFDSSNEKEIIDYLKRMGGKQKEFFQARASIYLFEFR